MISAKLLNGNIISRDADFSKYIETVSEPGVINGFIVSASKVGIGKARVPVSRSNGESLYVLVISDSETSISGDGDVYINIPQEIIDNGEIANEDGTGIATIEVGTMPSKNALKLATISNGAVTDARNILKKVSDLEPLISALDERTTTLEEEVGEILDKGAIDHLEESGLVGEKYTLSDTLFMQQSPLSSNCTLEANVGDVDANKQIHIQRMGSGTESNQIQLKLKKAGEPTQNLIVEIRRGVKVDVSSNEAYWYGDEVITSSSIAYGNITTDFAEYTVTFPESFGATQGELLDIVVRQNSDIVNSTNYYVIACDSTQYSEAYSYVSVNGTTRARSKLMPYCSSSGFAQSLLCKVGTFAPIITNYETITKSNTNIATIWTTPVVKAGIYTVKIKAKTSTDSGNNFYYLSIKKTNKDGETVGASQKVQTLTEKEFLRKDLYFNEGDIIAVCGYYSSYTTCTISSIEIGYISSDSEYTSKIYYLPEATTETGQGTTIYSCPCQAGKIQFSCNLFGNSNYKTQISIYKNGTEIYTTYSTTNAGDGKSVLEYFDVDAGDVISRKFYTTVSSVGSSNKATGITIKYFGEPIRLTPTMLKPIGQIVPATSFGEVNGNFKGGQFIGETTDIITGDIALGNAVGYLVVNYNGNALKIPYYL